MTGPDWQPPCEIHRHDSAAGMREPEPERVSANSSRRRLSKTQSLLTKGMVSRDWTFGSPRSARRAEPSAAGQELNPPQQASDEQNLLSERIGGRPRHRTWKDEWVDLNQETSRRAGRDPTPLKELEGDGKFSWKEKLHNYDGQVQWKVARGWTIEDAEAHVALAAPRFTLVLTASFEERSQRFAASSHAMYGALLHAAQLEAHLPKPCYAFIEVAHGKGLVHEVDPQFAEFRPGGKLSKEGAAFTCRAEIYAWGGAALAGIFPGDEMRPCMRQLKGGAETFGVIDEDVDVIAFISEESDDQCLHHPIHVNAGGYRIPPGTRVTLKRYHNAGEWTTVNGVKPNCGCCEVTVSYRQPVLVFLEAHAIGRSLRTLDMLTECTVLGGRDWKQWRDTVDRWSPIDRHDTELRLAGDPKTEYPGYAKKGEKISDQSRLHLDCLVVLCMDLSGLRTTAGQVTKLLGAPACRTSMTPTFKQIGTRTAGLPTPAKTGAKSSIGSLQLMQ